MLKPCPPCEGEFDIEVEEAVCDTSRLQSELKVLS
jgi:hypothetical protein